MKAFFSSEMSKEEKYQGLKKAVLAFGALIIVGFALAHMFGTFEGLRDAQQYSEIPGFLDAVIADRKAMLLSDTIRSLVLVLISGTALWLFLKGKVKPVIVIVGLTLLILFDLISVNKKYVNADDFKTARKIKKPFTKSDADKLSYKIKAITGLQILQ